MRNLLYGFFVIFITTVFFSCSQKIAYVKKTDHTIQEKQKQLASLSNIYGFKISNKDNIQLYEACSHWLGVKYKWGGNTTNGIDCSGLVKIIFKQVFGIDTERNSAAILNKNCFEIGRYQLQEGDLVFFRTFGSGDLNIPTHVGIYLKYNRFIHVSTIRGVTVSNLTESYFRRNWLTAGRVKK